METLDPKLKAISESLANHYTQKFREHGATPRGVDWGREEDLLLRYSKMLEVVREEDRDTDGPVQILDVGCGYGGLLTYAHSQGMQIDYTGLDLSSDLLERGRAVYPSAHWIHADLLTLSPDKKYDYVVCNGILTQKLLTSTLDMNDYAHAVIRKLYSLCDKGVAFNIMTTLVNFQKDNLYYRSPAELLAFCLNEITRKVRLDHAYPLYEYTVYLYR